MRRRRTAPLVIGAAALGTLAADIAVLATGHARPAADRPAARPAGGLVSVAQAAPPAGGVAPLGRRLVPHLLIAGRAPLPAASVERARRTKGVAGLAVVDAARTRIGERPAGILGVDPSTFRTFAPARTAESDQLWRTVATGGLAVSFDLARDGSLPLGGVVRAGGARPAQLRVGAYASMGIGSVDAVVSRAEARGLGMPAGNGLVVSASRTSPRKLAARLKKVLPRGTSISVLGAKERRAPGAAAPAAQPQVTGRPDGVTGPATLITGNSMTPTMRGVVVAVNGMFGPFPVIGCYRAGVDAQDHGDGRACDFMESTGGRMPSASARRHGDQLAAYAVANARRLGVSYVIWKQHIWNVRGGGWRPMENRGGITANHYDHVHVSVLR
ncbi:hypothetical protein [Actinomadura parmotrematis]|uniref:hypothetical protein n=1 Tax=Actinomadura parmotrematis TaxID=2864039 RepID=UPI00215DBE6D|nr:hypothetical protein [Actinomadura parmotrematis]